MAAHFRLKRSRKFFIKKIIFDSGEKFLLISLGRISHFINQAKQQITILSGTTGC